jgi:glycosyltransferase involved in cell wall biosynthesis
MHISVITVTKNAERFLSDCLASVAAQGDSLFEHIIVDGGSSDTTLDIIKKYASQDLRIRWISEPDTGIANAMNKGLKLATGDVVAFLNADDYYPNAQVLAAVSEYFVNNPEDAWLTGGAMIVSQNGSVIKEVRAKRYSFRRLVRGNILLHPSTFVQLALIRRVGGFNDSLSYCMDYDLFLRLGSVKAPRVVGEQLSCYRVHSSSHSVSNSERAYAEEFMVRMNYLRSVGKFTGYYRLDYQIKRHLNKLFYRRLLASGKS